MRCAGRPASPLLRAARRVEQDERRAVGSIIAVIITAHIDPEQQHVGQPHDVVIIQADAPLHGAVHVVGHHRNPRP